MLTKHIVIVLQHMQLTTPDTLNLYRAIRPLNLNGTGERILRQPTVTLHSLAGGDLCEGDTQELVTARAPGNFQVRARSVSWPGWRLSRHSARIHCAVRF